MIEISEDDENNNHVKDKSLTKKRILIGIIFICFAAAVILLRNGLRYRERGFALPSSSVKRKLKPNGIFISGIEVTDEEYKSIQMYLAMRINVIYGSFFKEYRASIEDAVKIIPFPIRFDDSQNLVKQVTQYRKYIVKEIDDIASSGLSQRDTSDSTTAKALKYSQLLKRFDREHFIFKAEFVQCLVFGDDISDDAKEYVKQRWIETNEKIRILTNNQGPAEELAKMTMQREFYTIINAGRGIADYYGLGE